MGAMNLLFITISHNVSFMGKTWWMLMLVLRLLVLLLAGFTLFIDEQERFVCNTIQPGCSNVCFDVFAPSFLCYEAPCTSGVECYISRPTEKTLMLNFMLGVASLSILLSLVDLMSSMKAMVRWRRKREMFMEEMSKGEQSSMFTATTMTEDSDVLSTRGICMSGGLKNGLKDEKHTAAINSEPPHTKVNAESTNDNVPERRDTKTDVSQSPTPMSTPVPTHFVLHSHLRPPLSSRPDRGHHQSPGCRHLWGSKSWASTLQLGRTRPTV
ncbi:Gap junction delta-4 protein Connexin-40.1 [Larimichthys crocea]|uniref:Gap junction protein n=1 Tax=Larimichthys crocea TaxID=215358 RepID=A0A6G0IGB2_LARCR|nr:Gap junction delta-4 protein Connexin-40.1 [Larimichthys crocea]